MRFSSIFGGLLALSGSVLGQDLDFSKWKKPGPKDVRGPCPAMNSLANHGFFPHDGRNITVPMMVDVLGKVFNLSPEMATIVGHIGLATRSPDATFLDLPDLNKHNAFEHDGSMSRVDFYHSGPEGVGKFDQKTFNRFFSYFKGMKYITREVAAAARYSLIKYSRKNTPGFTYESQHRITSYAEVIKFMKTMVDETGQCRTDFVKILFGEFPSLPFIVSIETGRN